MILGLRTVIYRVDDLDRARAWYREAFEIEPYFVPVGMIGGPRPGPAARGWTGREVSELPQPPDPSGISST